jgi:hypothetical protein
MPLAALFASHTPLKDYLDPGPGIAAEVDACLAEARAWVQAFAPELVIEFAPDHFNGFFYQLMPSFCIGAAAESVGDWKTATGPLPVAGELAQQLVESVHADGVDVALSHRMTVDHGFTQLLEILFDAGKAPPLIPVFINCAAPPAPRWRACGRWARRSVASLPPAGSACCCWHPAGCRTTRRCRCWKVPRRPCASASSPVARCRPRRAPHGRTTCCAKASTSPTAAAVARR